MRFQFIFLYFNFIIGFSQCKIDFFEYRICESKLDNSICFNKNNNDFYYCCENGQVTDGLEFNKGYYKISFNESNLYAFNYYYYGQKSDTIKSDSIKFYWINDGDTDWVWVKKHKKEYKAYLKEYRKKTGYFGCDTSKKANGYIIEYYKKGLKRKEATYKDGEAIGKMIYYDFQGNIKLIEYRNRKGHLYKKKEYAVVKYHDDFPPDKQPVGYPIVGEPKTIKIK